MKLVKKIQYISTFIFTFLFVSLLFCSNSYSREFYTSNVNLNQFANNTYECSIDDYNLDFGPYNSPDYTYEVNNYTCLWWAATSAISSITAEIGVDLACTDALSVAKNKEKLTKLQKTVRVLRSAGRSGFKSAKINVFAFLDPVDTAHVSAGLQGLKCAKSLVTGSASAITCCISATAGAAVIEAVPFGVLGDLYKGARDGLKNVRVCGYDWYNYYKEDSDLNNYPIQGSYEGSYSYKIKECLINNNCPTGWSGNWNIQNKIFREYVYGGREFTDNRCKDPRKDEYKGFSDDYQRYYLKGLEKGNYACYDRFGEYLWKKSICKSNNVNGKNCAEQLEDAYNCCIEESKTTLCLERTDDLFSDICQLSGMSQSAMCSGENASLKEYNFCQKGSVCNIKSKVSIPYSGSTLEYEIYNNPQYSNMLCAKVINVCPYNHNVFLGMQDVEKYDCTFDKSASARPTGNAQDCNTIFQDPDADTLITTTSYGKPKNYCQLNANCVYVAHEPAPKVPSLPSKFFSSACRDMRGDSLNYVYRMKKNVTLNQDSFWIEFKTSLEVPERRLADIIRQEANDANLSCDGTEENESDCEQMLDIANRVAGTEFRNKLANFITIFSGEVLLNNRVTLDEFLGFRGFTAPVVQCVKETLQNMFFNIEGYTACNSTLNIEIDENGECHCLEGDYLNADGLCVTRFGNPYDPYQYKKGRLSSEGVSGLSYLQNIFRTLVRLVLILSITFMGLKALLFGFNPERADLRAVILYIVKFGLVYYFAVGQGWQNHFANYILNISGDVSSIIYTTFHPIEQKCPINSDWNVADERCECQNNMIWDESSNTCVCPIGSTLRGLTAPNSCECNAGLVFDSTGNRCVCENSFTSYNTVLETCVCPGNSVLLADGTCGAPANSTLVDVQNQIYQCNSGYRWDSSQQACVNGTLLIPGNGYIEFSYTGDAQTLSIPDCFASGTLKMQVWGASAGDVCGTATLGRGGYSYGELTVSSAQNLHIYVGGKGSSSYIGGWNGGGNGACNFYGCGIGGGGATDIREINGVWDDVTSLASRILVAGGGGGRSEGCFEPGGAGGSPTSGGELTAKGATTITCNGGGGGGGYRGGISTGCGGAEGGSNYADSTLLNAILQESTNDGDGFVRICWGNNVNCDQGSSSYTPLGISNDSLCQPASNGSDIPPPPSQDIIITDMPTNSIVVPYSNVEIGVSDIDYNNPSYDGCYFDKDDYPTQSRYLAMWDMFDCKIARYIGYGPDVSLPSIIVLIMLGLFFGPLGILFFILSLTFAIFVILVAIRVAVIFLISMFGIIFFLYISPLTIPLLLFERTKEVFNKWLSQLISFLIQPIILFAYISIFFNITEPILLGSAYFTGDVKGGRTLVCEDSARFDSLLCLFGNHSRSPLGFPKEVSGFKAIGIAIYTLSEEAVVQSYEAGKEIYESGKEIATGPKKSFLQLITIFKGLILIYLFFNILDQIPQLASMLSGGLGYQGGRGSLGDKLIPGGGVADYSKKLFGNVGGIQKAGTNLIRGNVRRGKNIVKGTYNKTRNLVSKKSK